LCSTHPTAAAGAFETAGALSLAALADSHFLTLTGDGALDFFDLATRRAVDKKQMVAHSVLLNTTKGFFELKAQERAGVFQSFSLSHSAIVSPVALYRRLCGRGCLGDALQFFQVNEGSTWTSPSRLELHAIAEWGS
jgi:hypothetical protein